MKTKSITAAIVLVVLFLSLIGPAQTPTTGFFHQDLGWSPDSSGLVFSAMKNGQTDLYKIRADGTGLTRLTEKAGNNVWASYSPDSRRIAFQSNRDGGQGDVWVMNADGSNPVQLTRDAGRNAYPSWSPDGKRIVFASTREGGQQIFVMNADGSQPMRITTPTTDGTKYFNPVWSPRGNKRTINRIVFYSDRGDHKDQILLVDADGANQKVLSGGVGHNTFPSWLPDGRRIMFTSDREPTGRALFVINADGTNLKRLVGNADSFFARWSPNGKHIAYIAGKYPTTEIYLMNKDGRNAVKLTK